MNILMFSLHMLYRAFGVHETVRSREAPPPLISPFCGNGNT